jgi:hypothetical protein
LGHQVDALLHSVAHFHDTLTIENRATGLKLKRDSTVVIEGWISSCRGSYSPSPISTALPSFVSAAFRHALIGGNSKPLGYASIVRFPSSKSGARQMSQETLHGTWWLAFFVVVEKQWRASLLFSRIWMLVFGNMTAHWKGAQCNHWHCLQWQCFALNGLPAKAKRTALHQQDDSYFVLKSSSPSVPHSGDQLYGGFDIQSFSESLPSDEGIGGEPRQHQWISEQMRKLSKAIYYTTLQQSLYICWPHWHRNIHILEERRICKHTNLVKLFNLWHFSFRWIQEKINWDVFIQLSTDRDWEGRGRRL